jgi:hypothetical protein
MVTLRSGSGVHRALIALDAGDGTSHEVSRTTGIPLRPSLSSYLRRLQLYGFADNCGSVKYDHSNQDGNRWRITPMGRDALRVAARARRGEQS